MTMNRPDEVCLERSACKSINAHFFSCLSLSLSLSPPEGSSTKPKETITPLAAFSAASRCEADSWLSFWI